MGVVTPASGQSTAHRMTRIAMTWSTTATSMWTTIQSHARPASTQRVRVARMHGKMAATMERRWAKKFPSVRTAMWQKAGTAVGRRKDCHQLLTINTTCYQGESVVNGQPTRGLLTPSLTVLRYSHISLIVPKLCSQDNIGDGYVLSGNRCYATCGNGRPGGAVLCKEDTTWDESGLCCPDLWCACPPHIMSRINQMMASVSFASGEFCISCTKREWVVKEVYLYDSWCILNLNILETRN